MIYYEYIMKYTDKLLIFTYLIFCYCVINININVILIIIDHGVSKKNL